MTTHASRICDYPHCGRPNHGWSSWCTMHANRYYTHGVLVGKAGVRESDLKPFAEWVKEGLIRYRSTAATLSALQLAEELLQYRAPNTYRYQLDLERIMSLMRDHQVIAGDILGRVCLAVAYIDAHPDRFKGSTKAEDLALGRLVLRLIPVRKAGHKYPARAVALLGGLVRDALYVYALALVKRMKLDAETRHALKEQTLAFDTPAEVPADAPRAGLRYRRKRGVVVP